MTLVETMVAMVVMSTFLLAVAYIEITAAKQTLVLFSDARTIQRAHLVLQRVRSKMIQGEVGSPAVTDDGRTLTFRNPNLPTGVTSGFKFMSSTGKLYYYADMTLAPSTPGRGIGLINDVSFEVLGAGNAVQTTVRTVQRYSWRLPRPYTLSQITTLRN